jgi:GNAT superfamily N-acetyltransferase
MNKEHIFELLTKTIDHTFTMREVSLILTHSLVIEEPYGVAIGRFIDEDGEFIFYLYYLAVDPEHQNQGIGTRLMEKVEQAVKLKVSKIKLRSLDEVAHFDVNRGYTPTGTPIIEDGRTYRYYVKYI